MNFSKKVKREKRDLFSKLKISLILLCIGLCSNAQDNPDNIFGYYFSNQEGPLSKSILYHFSCDSLLVYNAGRRQYLKFNANYQTNKIFVNSSQIKDYELNIEVQNDSIIELVDSDNIFSSDIKNKLVKFKIDSEIDIYDLTNKYWKRTHKNDYIIWYFHFKIKKIDEYGNINEYTSNMGCNPLDRDYFKFKDLYAIDFYMSGNLLVTTKIANDTLTFKRILPNGKLVSDNFIKYKEKINDISINGKWKKVNSKNSFDLPEDLVITDRIINISDTIVNYRLGLDKRFIIYRKDGSRSIKIEKITDNQLNLNIRSNTTHSEEIGIYEKM